MNKVLQKLSIYIIIICLLVASTLFATPFTSAQNKEYYVVIEESTNRVLYESNSNDKKPMASTTKIITALTVLESANLEDEVVIPKEAQGVEGSSVYLKAGDIYTVKDLLYGLMLQSGNDCAVALAIHVAGSIEKFASLMNEKAKEAGAFNTNFTNPHGLHDKEHFTTAYDLAILTSLAYKNPSFVEIVSSKKYKFNDRYIYNKNKLLSSFEGADGVKTGYTTIAGRCLVSSSKREDMRVICVVLDCYDMWNKSAYLMNKAHEEYTLTKIVSTSDVYNAKVFGGINPNVSCSTFNDVYYPLNSKESEKIKYDLSLNDLNAPVYKNQFCGTIKVYLDKCLIFEENIYTIDNVRKKTLFDQLKEWF